MNSTDDTDRTPVEGEDVHQGARGLDAFSVQQGPAVVGEGGAPGASPDAPDAPGPTPEKTRAAARRAELAANTWANRGAELAKRVLARVEGVEAPIATPWPSINSRLGGGLWPGMHVVVGGTGTGKSQWALQVAMGAAREGVPVLVLSLELDALGVFARGASFFTGEVDGPDGRPLPHTKWSAFYTGGRNTDAAKTDRDRARVREALPLVLPSMEALPFHWFESPPHGLPHTEIAALAADLRALHPNHGAEKPVVMVVDFLQLVAGTDPKEDTITRVSRASYACRHVARELNAVVLVLSSTSRASVEATRVKPRESLSELPPRAPAYDLVGLGKESGDVEFSADSVLVLCPETMPDTPDGKPAPPMKGGRPVHLAIAKLRAGAPGWCELRFNGSRFVEPPPPPGAGRAWCEECQDAVRTQPHESKPGALLCTRAGHTIEANADAEPDTVPAEKPAPRRGRERKGKAPAATSTPAEPAAPDTNPDHPAETDF